MADAKKILVVEDDKFLGTAYRAKISKAGFDFRLAEDGEEAVKILGEFTPDLILLDLILPKKDGFTVLEEIKANEKWKNIPVIIASNLGQKEDLERGMNLGAVDFVVKSDMSLESLIQKINETIQTKPQS